MIQVLFFGQLTEYCGCEHTAVLSASDTEDLLHQLKTTYKGLNTAVFCIAVNNKIVTDNHPLKENDVVALMPPFSGG